SASANAGIVSENSRAIIKRILTSLFLISFPSSFLNLKLDHLSALSVFSLSDNIILYHIICHKSNTDVKKPAGCGKMTA
ncbi:MAG: hypothetical protein Q4F32_08405, partial [Eubacteriales bacterium]|nr:hypothetical protein [Eubacteriales bacterium]